MIKKQVLLDDKKIFIIQDYISSHLEEELDLGKLAEKAAISPFHFHREYKAATGETLYDFVQRKRLEKACFLLSLNRDLKIVHIALQSGYQLDGRTYFERYTGGSIGEKVEPLSVEICIPVRK